MILKRAKELVDIVNKREKKQQVDFNMLEELLSLKDKVITSALFPVEETDPIPSESIDFVF